MQEYFSKKELVMNNKVKKNESRYLPGRIYKSLVTTNQMITNKQHTKKE